MPECVPALGERTFAAIAGLMYDSIGLSFSDNKRPLVASRLASRIQRLGLRSYEDYLALIQRPDDGGEFQVAVDLLTTNETYFFREPEHFNLIERELVSARPQRLSVWSAAASFGDEAYSVAMLLADLQAQQRIGRDWSILATDISDRVLQAAAMGVYPQARLHHVSADRLRRHCLRGENESEGLVAMQPKLKEHVSFGQLNLCAEFEGTLPGAPFDIILLRNVLIYFDVQTKCAVMDRVLTQLRPGGLFFVGTAEARVKCTTPLSPILPGAFRKAAK